MEESEKRKERLKAMRMEAAQAGLHSEAGNSVGVFQSLTNPLIEPSASSSMPADSRASPRFDFYTDPMAAFSANKRGSKVSHQNTPDYFTSPRPRNLNLPPFPVQTNSSQDTRMVQAQGSYQSPAHLGSPMQTANPYGAPQGNPNFWRGPSGPPTHHYPSNSPRPVQPSSPGFGQDCSPNFNYGQGRPYGFNNNPQCGPDSGGSPYSNIGRGYSPQGGSGYRGSPYSNPGRGNNYQARPGNRGTPFTGPIRGRSGGRGRGSHIYVSAEERPDQYFNKSMMEDPWKTLKPVVWQQKFIPTQDSEKSWLPKSVASKKARVSEALDKFKSKQSLAEYLAASFNEAVQEPDDEDAQETI